MPVRTSSTSGIYHVIIRGVNRCIIFEDDADYKTFLKYLGVVRRKFQLTLYCYCLMSNHVHLLVRESENNLPQAMHYLNMHYAMYFNAKYERVGHLLQGRFKSKPVENRQYFYTLIKYILLNPSKAYGITPSDYPWSSYRDYIYGFSTTDTQALWAELGGRTGFLELMQAPLEEIPDDCELERSFSDKDAINLIIELIKMDPSILAQINHKERNNALRVLKNNRFSVRQLARLTGLSRSVIQRA